MNAPIAPFAVFEGAKRERRIRDAWLRDLLADVTRLHRVDPRGAAVDAHLTRQYLHDYAKRIGAAGAAEDDPAG